MSFNKARRKRDPFGPRFGELMGKHCHQALTAAARGKREEFDSLVKDLYQMLNSIETETEWPEENKGNEPTTVAPESERPAASAGDTTQDSEGLEVVEPTVKRKRSTNKRKKRATGTGSTGRDGFKTAERKPDVDGE